MSSSKKWRLKNIFTAYGVCGCGRRKPTDIFEPKPKSKTSLDNHDSGPNPSSSSSWERCGVQCSIDDDEDCTSTTFSLNIETLENDPKCSKMVSPCPKICDSLAIVKDSEDPYQDFRQSMLQMILEREIYSTTDLQELLNCFLELNSPHHHEVIVKAFIEIWNGVHSKTPPAAASGTEEIKSPLVLHQESRDT
ncbi:transcription repressor OFP6-like [Forsythia ovata]|uniref:Transcription repressor n=1 Tax=Forsythia ovata TaxID=205694 RepID=A0ABD1VFE9_9LAMI